MEIPEIPREPPFVGGDADVDRCAPLGQAVINKSSDSEHRQRVVLQKTAGLLLAELLNC